MASASLSLPGDFTFQSLAHSTTFLGQWSLNPTMHVEKSGPKVTTLPVYILSNLLLRSPFSKSGLSMKETSYFSTTKGPIPVEASHASARQGLTQTNLPLYTFSPGRGRMPFPKQTTADNADTVLILNISS